MRTPDNRLKTPALAALLLVALAACDGDQRLSGTYGRYEADIWFPVLDFSRSGKVTLKVSGSGDDETGSYQRHGNQLIVEVAGEIRTLSLDDKGCLAGGADNKWFSGVICKKP